MMGYLSMLPHLQLSELVARDLTLVFLGGAYDKVFILSAKFGSKWRE